MTQDDAQPDERELEELLAAADGTLPADRLAALERRAESDPVLAARLERQRTAVTALRSVEVDAVAPLALRSRIIESVREQAPAPRRSWRPRLAFGLGIAGAAAAVLLVVVLALPSGSPGGPSVVQAAELAERPPQQAAPGVDPADPRQLSAEQSGVPFPNWAAKLGWRPVGARTDKLDGRDATTVFYEKDGKRIGYTIVSGAALDQPGGADVTTRKGTEFRVFRLPDGSPAVTWEEQGQTCVLSGADLPDPNLIKLAAW